VGQLADGCFQAALASFVFFSPERQTSAFRVALAFAVILLPYSLVGPFAGVLLDRWSRQRVLVLANWLRAAGCLVVMGLVLAGRDDAVFLAGALAVIGVNRFILSGLAASLPHVVERDILVTGNAVSTTAGTLSTVAGVGLGVGLRLVVGAEDSGVAVVVAAAALGYVVAGALAALLLERSQLGPDLDEATDAVREAVGSVLRGFLEGAAHLWGRRPVRAAIGALGVYRVGWGLITVSAILLFRATYNDVSDPDAGLEDLGRAFFLGGLGIFAAALVAPSLARRFGPQRVIWVSLLVAAGGELVLGSAFTSATLLASAPLIAGAGQALKICVDTIVQSGIEDTFRGRVFSVYDLVFNVGFVAAGIVAALLLPPGGRSPFVLGLAVACWAAGGLAYARVSRRSMSAPQHP
jgi:MFS family permease